MGRGAWDVGEMHGQRLHGMRAGCMGGGCRGCGQVACAEVLWDVGRLQCQRRMAAAAAGGAAIPINAHGPNVASECYDRQRGLPRCHGECCCECTQHCELHLCMKAVRCVHMLARVSRRPLSLHECCAAERSGLAAWTRCMVHACMIHPCACTGCWSKGKGLLCRSCCMAAHKCVPCMLSMHVQTHLHPTHLAHGTA